MKVLVSIIILMTALVGGAISQVDPYPGPGPLSLAGKQTSAGIFSEQLNETRGNTFVLDGSNRPYSSTLLTVTFEYIGIAEYESGNEISGGTWNLAIYMDGQYIGSVFGKITKGFIRWSPIDGTRYTEATLFVSGGTGAFENVSEHETYLNSTTDLQSDIASGDLTGLDF